MDKVCLWTALLVFPLYSLQAVAQLLPPLSMQYIDAKPPDIEGVRLVARQMSAERYESFKVEITNTFTSSVNRVDMLPIDKEFFTDKFKEVKSLCDELMVENPYAWNFPRNAVEARTIFEEEALNQSLIQRAKTRYIRVLGWENYLREKNLFDKFYSNSKGPTSLTNRQALNILYGSDKKAFEDLAWE